MSTPAIDYDALAAQHGGAPAVDYDALAAQHGGTSSAAPTSASPPPPTSDPLAKMLGQQKQTDLERWLQPTQHDPSQGVMGNVGTALSNIGAAGLNALTHPEQLITGAVMSSPPVAAYTAVP